MSDGDFTLILIGMALADERFGQYEAKDWRGFLKAIVRQLHVDGDTYVDTERASAWLDRSVAKRDEIAARTAPPPARLNLFMFPRRDDKES